MRETFYTCALLVFHCASVVNAVSDGKYRWRVTRRIKIWSSYLKSNRSDGGIIRICFLFSLFLHLYISLAHFRVARRTRVFALLLYKHYTTVASRGHKINSSLRLSGSRVCLAHLSCGSLLVIPETLDNREISCFPHRRFSRYSWILCAIFWKYFFSARCSRE